MRVIDRAGETMAEDLGCGIEHLHSLRPGNFFIALGSGLGVVSEQWVVIIFGGLELEGLQNVQRPVDGNGCVNGLHDGKEMRACRSPLNICGQKAAGQDWGGIIQRLVPADGIGILLNPVLITIWL
jgi:hypothetical protein